MTIYVVVVVTYDYYRFQDNAGATTQLNVAMDIANKLAAEKEYPVITDADYSISMDEMCHIWIQKFENV